MQKTLAKIATFFTLFMLVIAPAFVLALPVKAADDLDVGLDVGLAQIENDIALSNTDPREIAANVINVILGFLGIIAVVIILLGGFKWMTAGGNEEKVEEAQKLLKSGIIGLIIILAAWGIASFVVGSLINSI